MPVTRIWWLLAAAVSGALAFAVGAPGAAAHGANGKPMPDAAHYLSAITAMTPPTPGLTARIDPRGEWLEVTNATTQPLTILGYAREPYLQIDADGVAENSSSPTLVLNQSLFGDVTQLGAATVPPSWHHLNSARQVRWHDHRIHWMGATRPPAVQADPAVGHLIGSWSVHMALAGSPVDIDGTLSWLPVKKHHSGWMIVFLIADSTLLACAVGGWFLLNRRRAARRGTAHGVPEQLADAAAAHGLASGMIETEGTAGTAPVRSGTPSD
jgi:hypothetical protein